MGEKENAVQYDQGAQALITDANKAMAPKIQVATVYLNDVIRYNDDGPNDYASVEIVDIVGYSGAENWFVIQKKDGVVVYNRDQVRAVEISFKDAE